MASDEELTDVQLKAKFDEIDLDGYGELSMKKLDDRKRIRAALRDLGVGNEDDEIDIDVITANEFSFSDFKALVKGKRKLAALHDVPVVGVITCTLENNLSDPNASISEVELRAAFRRLDIEGTGNLDKTDIAEALRQMGKSEAEIQTAIDGMTQESLDFTGLQELLRPAGPRPGMLWGVVPNPGKIHDVPILGTITHATQDLIVGASGLVSGAFKSLSSLNHEELKVKFDEFDVDGNGTLCRKEIAKAMRQLGKKEIDIKAVLDRMVDTPTLDFPGFKRYVRDTESSHALFGGSDMITDKELKEKFDKIDTDGDGEVSLLDVQARKEIRKALCELQGQKTDWENEIDLEVISSNVLNFSDFKSLVSGPRKLESLHDVPVVGVITGAVADNLMSSDMTEVEMRAAFERFDLDKSGRLDMLEIGSALRQMGRSEVHIQQVIDDMQSRSDEDIDFEGFKHLLDPPSRAGMTTIAGVRVPNPAKIHDLPLVGNITHMAQDVVTRTGGLLLAPLKAFRDGKVTKEDLKRTFNDVDQAGEGTGMLEKKDLAKVLRTLGMTEVEIKEIVDKMDNPDFWLPSSYEDFEALVQPSDDPSRLSSSGYPNEERREDPFNDHRLVTYAEMQDSLSASGMTEAQIQAHWTHLRPANAPHHDHTDEQQADVTVHRPNEEEQSDEDVSEKGEGDSW